MFCRWEAIDTAVLVTTSDTRSAFRIERASASGFFLFLFTALLT